MLQDHYEYYYTQKQIFCSELDNIHAFVMRNYKIGMHVQEFPEINIIVKGHGKAIVRAEVVAYEDLGTEAIHKLEVKDFPVVVVVDSAGNNLYETAVKQYRKDF